MSTLPTYILYGKVVVTLEKLAERFQNYRKKKKNTPPPDPLLLEIRELVSQMEAVRSLFDLTSDPNLIEGFIHEMNALNSRYSYLMTQAREKNLVCTYRPDDLFQERVYGKLG